MRNTITPESFLSNLAAFFDCRIVWWEATQILGVFHPEEGFDTGNPLPSLVHLNRLLSLSHPVTINKGQHAFCDACPDQETCQWSCEFFVPFTLSEHPMGMLWQFDSSAPVVDSPDWLKLAANFASLLALIENHGRDRLLAEFFRQSTELCGQLAGEGVVLFDAKGDPIFQNDVASELHLVQRFRDSNSAQIEQTLRKKKELELFLDNPDPLTVRLRSLYFSKTYLGRVLVTTQGYRKTQNDHLLAARKQFGFLSIIGKNSQLNKAIAIANQVAPTDSTIILRGESGTGKEMFARTIHEKSLRKEGPFIAINCAAIPETLLESELFGYEEGSFTGARKGGKPGKLELAHHGTIFLDEIGDLPLSLQGKLLRVLQDKRVERVGGTSPFPVDVRIITATHHNLEDMIASGRFREDLFYRISVIPIHIPPLRDRPEDIELLLDYYTRKYCILLNKEFKTFSYEALNLLRSYSWPGNIRELVNVVEYSITIDDKDEIGVESLPLQIRHLQRDQFQPEASKAHVIRPGRNELAELLNRFGYSAEGKKELARHLGVSVATLYRWLKKNKL